MHHEIVFGGEPEDVMIRTSGAATLDGFQRFVADLVGDERYRSGIAILVDHSQLDPSTLTTAEIRALADSVATLASKVEGNVVACVAPGDAMFGLSRAFEMAAEGTPIRAGAFRTCEAAREWLAVHSARPSAG